MWAQSIVLAILFIITAHPALFKAVRKVLGAWVANADGLATPAGLLLHGALLVLLAVYLPKTISFYAPQPPGAAPCGPGTYYSVKKNACLATPQCGTGQYFSYTDETCKPKPACGPSQYFSLNSEQCREKTVTAAAPPPGAATGAATPGTAEPIPVPATGTPAVGVSRFTSWY